MKRFIANLLVFFLLANLLSSCQIEKPSESPESETEQATVHDTHPSTDDTVQVPPENQPEGEEPMENPTCFQNPILTAESENAWPGYGFGDPFVMRHNGVYYLYCSTKDGSVGIKCWSSYDLVNWKFEGFCTNHPITRGAYAPEVYYYNGYFYMAQSQSGNGHYILKADKPEGPFKAITGNFGESIDGSFFIDDDEQMYLLRASNTGIRIIQLNDDLTLGTSRTLDNTVLGGWTEGPYMLQRNGNYYLTYTGTHFLSASYRVNYAFGDKANDLLNAYSLREQDTILLSTKDDLPDISKIELKRIIISSPPYL